MRLLTEFLGWLQIVAFPFTIGLIIGFFVYFSNQNILNLIIGILISLIGLIIGIVIATRIKRTTGTVNFLSKQISNTEFQKNKE